MNTQNAQEVKRPILRKVLLFFVPVLIAMPLAFVFVNAPDWMEERRQAPKREIWLECKSPNFAYPDENPLAAIGLAIAKDKVSARFRTRWYDSLGSGHDEGWILYDRPQSTLEFKQVGGSDGGTYHSAYSFTRVTDEVLIDLTNKFNAKATEKIVPSALPKLLPKYGCIVRKIADVKTGDFKQ